MATNQASPAPWTAFLAGVLIIVGTAVVALAYLAASPHESVHVPIDLPAAARTTPNPEPIPPPLRGPTG